MVGRVAVIKTLRAVFMRRVDSSLLSVGGEMVVNTSLGFIHTSDVIIVTPVIGPVVAFV